MFLWPVQNPHHEPRTKIWWSLNFREKEREIERERERERAPSVPWSKRWMDCIPIWGVPQMGVPLIIHLNGIFPYYPSIWGYGNLHLWDISMDFPLVQDFDGMGWCVHPGAGWGWRWRPRDSWDSGDVDVPFLVGMIEPIDFHGKGLKPQIGTRWTRDSLEGLKSMDEQGSPVLRKHGSREIEKAWELQQMQLLMELPWIDTCRGSGASEFKRERTVLHV